MTYKEVEEYLFNSFADFQKYGQSALIYDLSNIKKLCDALGNPQDSIKTIHVAGTNGKGSSSHMLASILQEAGYKTGLYTSPHLVSYTERIKINGNPVDEKAITEFVNQNLDTLNNGKFSFFEITTAMAFSFFAKEKVDVAVIEVGLGGRLDATNIIIPELSIITNISFDHVQILGNTIDAIAREKAGIIKANVPVIVSEFTEKTQKIFLEIANDLDSDIFFASKLFDIAPNEDQSYHCIDKISKTEFRVFLDLKGKYQQKNLAGVLTATKVLTDHGWKIKPDHILDGLLNIKKNTQLKGRWQVLNQKPLIICDTAHNEAGITELVSQSLELKKPLHLVLNFTKEKEASKILSLLPETAQLYFVDSQNPRMRTAAELHKSVIFLGINSKTFGNINEAIKSLKESVPEDEAIIIFGSNFIIAEIENL
jgi:dihydrofolate synthase / folylpolyglutamate synthase